jgi:hypothetical protein
MYVQDYKKELEKIGHKLIDSEYYENSFDCIECGSHFWAEDDGYWVAYSDDHGVDEFGSVADMFTCNELIIRSVIE